MAGALSILHDSIKSNFGTTTTDDDQVTIIIKATGVLITDRDNGIVCRDETPDNAAGLFTELVERGGR